MILNLISRQDAGYPRISGVALLSFCGYVIIWYLQIGYRVPFLGEIRFEFLYAASLTVFIFFHTNKIECTAGLVFPVFLLFLSMIIEIPFSYNVDVSINVFLDRVVKFSFMALFIIFFVRSPRHLAFFLAAFFVACMKMGLEGFIGQVTGNMVWENQGVMRLHGSTPLYEHPNSFTGMALGTIPFVIFLYPGSPRFIKIVLSVSLIFSLIIVLYSGSRTGYVAFIILLIFAFFKSRNKIKLLLFFVVSLTILLSVVDHSYIERFDSIFSGKDKEGRSTELRKEIISDAVDIFIENPFGVGLSAFPAAREAKFNRTQDTHNLYMEVLTNLGVQGFIVFIFFIYRIFCSLSSNKKKLSDIRARLHNLSGKINISELESFDKDIRFLQAVSDSVFMYIIVRLSLGLFGMDLYEIYWWFIFGLVVALDNIVKYAKLRMVNIEGGW